MNKKIIITALAFVALFSTQSCKKKPTPTASGTPQISSSEVEIKTISSFIDNVSDSEKNIKGYKEVNQITKGELLMYKKDIDYKIDRESSTSSYSDVETKIELYSDDLSTTTTSYAYETKDNNKYINGKVVDDNYKLPSFVLIFNLNDEYLDDINISSTSSTDILEAKVNDDKTSSFFLDKTYSNMKNVSITIKLEDNKITSFYAKYTSSDRLVEITINYLYE